MNFIVNKRRGFSLAEIMIAVCVVVVIAIPILYMTMSTRKDTTHAINYLRAIELGNEVLDWVNCLRYEQITTETFLNCGLCESLNEDTGGSPKCKALNVSNTSANDKWNSTSNFLTNDVKYPDQYAMHYFYRDVKVDNVDGNDNIKKITVKVTWAESYTPRNIQDGTDRNKEIVLSTIVMRDRDFPIAELEN